MSLDTSSLPPLESTHGTKSPDSESSNSSFGSENTPHEIKKSILQIYPRLHLLEEDIKDIRQQLPSELNKNILQVRKDIFDLKERSGNQTSDKNDVLSKLKDLENQMNFKVDSYIDDFLSSYKKKINSKSKQKNAFKLSSTQDEFDKNLDSISNLFSQYNKSTDQRILNLEQKIAKLTSQSTRIQSIDDVEKMRKLVQRQNIRLSELNANLNSMIQVSLKTPQTNNLQITRSTLSSTNDTMIPATKVDNPDLAGSIQTLSQQIQTFKTEFRNSLKNAQEKTQNCRNRLTEMKDMANEIHESASEIESKVIEVNNLCDSLSLQVKEMTHNLSQNTAQRTIDSISVQIKSVQDRIISELNSIKKRLRKCEMSEPLIQTDTSNKPSNTEEDDASLPAVTFGKIRK